MAKPRHEHGIEHEPHLSGSEYEFDPSEVNASNLLNRERHSETDDDRIEHNVWEEPALSSKLVGEPDEEQLTYPRWLERRIKETDLTTSIWATLLIALSAGPWGVIGALWAATKYGGNASFGLVAVVVFGPVAEEVVKIATAWWVVEKRPYLFKSVGQILFCAACGGLAFAAIENLVYMYVYVPDHTEAFVRFRWSVCVALHVTCSMIAGLGLARIWDNAIRNLHRPQVALGIPWMVLAMTGHGLYNFAISIASMMGWLDFLEKG